MLLHCGRTSPLTCTSQVEASRLGGRDWCGASFTDMPWTPERFVHTLPPALQQSNSKFQGNPHRVWAGFFSTFLLYTDGCADLFPIQKTDCTLTVFILFLFINSAHKYKFVFVHTDFSSTYVINESHIKLKNYFELFLFEK